VSELRWLVVSDPSGRWLERVSVAVRVIYNQELRSPPTSGIPNSSEERHAPPDFRATIVPRTL
jgi:hypothetical protein